MEGSEKIPSGWIKVKSKSRPDKYYFYNLKTKQSIWKLEDLKNLANCNKNVAKKKTPTKKSPQKQLKLASSSKVIHKQKNLAQDRLKNLQNELKDEIQRGIEISNGKSNKNNNKVKELSPKKKLSSSSSTNKVQQKTSQYSNIDKVPAPYSNNTFNVSNSSSFINESQLKVENESMEIDEQGYKLESSQSIEPMEWEEIDHATVVKEVHNVRSKEDAQTQSSVMTKHINFKIKSSENEFYIIVDTNVLLSNLQFVKDIKGKTFKGEFYSKTIIEITFLNIIF